MAVQCITVLWGLGKHDKMHGVAFCRLLQVSAVLLRGQPVQSPGCHGGGLLQPASSDKWALLPGCLSADSSTCSLRRLGQAVLSYHGRKEKATGNAV